MDCSQTTLGVRSAAGTFSLRQKKVFFTVDKRSANWLSGAYATFRSLLVQCRPGVRADRVGRCEGRCAGDASTGWFLLQSHQYTRYRPVDHRPTIEFRLLFGFSLEADALYRGYREQSSFTSNEVIIPPGTNLNPVIPAFFVSSQSNTKVWDFPLLLKYRVGSHRFRPFVDAGYTFSHRTSDFTSFSRCLSSQAVCQASAPVFGNGTFRGSFSENSGGPTGGVGVEYRYGRVKIAPEVRYTHLSNPTSNLVTVMVGVTF